MKNALFLMLGLVAGTASFAQTNNTKTPETSVSVTTDQKVKLLVAAEEAIAAVTLRAAEGHLLYAENVNLHNGLRQYFNIA